jgi:phenylacetaldehyde dehydrogenase
LDERFPNTSQPAIENRALSANDRSVIDQEDAMNAAVIDPRLNPKTRDFLLEPHRLLIDGQWVDAKSGRTFEVLNPATGERIAMVAEGDTTDIDLAVRAARKAFDQGPWTRKLTPSERGRMLWRVGELIERDAETLAELEAIDNGKAKSVALAADVPLAADMFRYMSGWPTKLTGTTIPLSVAGANFHAYTVREPVGVAGLISPWNFPLLMAVWKLAPALASGCTVVMKHAEQTPLSVLYLGKLFLEAGLPPGVVNIVTGYGETAGAALTRHPLVDKISFTGSTEVGRMIARAAADTNMKKLTLELGGKAPIIVLDDADLDAAIHGSALAAFFNQGQACASGTRLYAGKKVFERVADGIAAIADKIRIGDGMDPTTEMGPVVSQEQQERVLGYIESGLSEGARRATARAQAGQPAGYFVSPTVLRDTRSTMRVMREEIFGPVLCVSPISDDDLDVVAAAANDTNYGLAASIWTRNVSHAHKLASRIKAGTVWVNCEMVFDAALPFGGYKESGWGRDMGLEVFNSYMETKAVTVAL